MRRLFSAFSSADRLRTLLTTKASIAGSRSNVLGETCRRGQQRGLRVLLVGNNRVADIEKGTILAEHVIVCEPLIGRNHALDALDINALDHQG
jgi:hypothetical protein